jgi:Xaa-Pro dipeptidase
MFCRLSSSHCFLVYSIVIPHRLLISKQIYFCKFIIEPYLQDPKHAKYIDEEVLKRYWEVGGVRIEDNVLITKDGFENLTTTPKSVEDMEKLINGA